ncbi:MAG: ureidoglycolate lyase, partial [Pseudomonadota bacterium]
MSAPIEIVACPLTAAAFAPYGDVLDADGRGSFPINAGRCQRFDDIARLAFDGDEGRPGLSIFRSEPVAIPHQVAAMERHPFGSQAFIPLSDHPFLVIVAPDRAGRPGAAEAFVTVARQGLNLHRNVWHAALAP